ncbi:hypothetical protein [Streptococcus uberis]|uniref:hypothetical protein n=1 Tax=Streptococcus uberis TaxID=1349 RepID=UPI003D76E0C0
MIIKNSTFEPSSIEKSNYRYIRLSIESLSVEDKDFIKNNLIEISSGRDSDFTLETEAKEIVKYIERLDIRKKIGAIAEFILIIVLRSNGFSQEFCYRNLEENSAKKGFDGLYSIGQDLWLVESKASAIGHNNTHRNTINRAYSSIEKQLNGSKEKSNNPWRNAHNHAKAAQTSRTIIKKIAKLSEDYTNEKFSSVEQNNIILGSIVIPYNINNNDNPPLISDIDIEINSLDKYISNHKSKNEIIIVVNLKTIYVIIDYIKDLAYGK